MSSLLECLFAQYLPRESQHHTKKNLAVRGRRGPYASHSNAIRRSNDANRAHHIGPVRYALSPTDSSDGSETTPSQHHGCNQGPYIRRLRPNIREFRLFWLEQSPNTDMITGRLDCWHLDNPPAYQALSYTWGNSMYVDDIHQRQNRNLEVREIRVNDQAFFVPRNLHEALLSLRQVPLSRYLWIDAICINQIDIEEKNHQVCLMKHIYREARSVIAWLGPSDRHSSISLRLVNEVNLTDDRPLRLRIIKRALKHSFEAAYRNLFRRSYWYRTWIIPEIHSARRIILQCGLDSVLWKDLVKFQKFLTDECSIMDRSHPWGPVISHDTLKRVKSSAKRFITLDTLRKSNPILQARRGKESRPRHLADLLLEHWDTLASNPRDKIFAIIGLASDSHLYDIDIDYRLSVCQIYTKFVMENIRLVGALDIILLRRPQNPAHGLPSWCPDWSSTASDSGNMLGDTYPFWTSGRPYHASKIVGSDIDNDFTVHFSPNGEIMAADGWRLGRVSNHSDVASFRGFEPRKRGLFNCSGLLSLCRLVPSEAHIEPSEMDVWYAIQRQALRRGFNSEVKKHLVNRTRRSYREYCAKKHDEFFRVIVRATSLEANEFIDSEILSDWRWHRDIPRNFDDRPNENMTPEMREVLRRLGRKMVHGGYKCFFVTGSGLMGLAPNETRKGDIVCVLRGCDMPVMLRATGVHFKLVGACYVVGFMHGQLYEYIERSRIPVPEVTFQIN